MICGYDARKTSDDILDTAWRTHTDVLTDDWQTSDRYEDPAEVMRALARAPAALPELRSVPVHSDARVFRRTLMAEMAADELPEAAAAQLLIAAGEVYANARRHGAGVRDVRVGRDGDQFVCEITDQGPGLDDPLAGHVPPCSDSTAGAGLWAARQTTRRLELQPAPGGGLSVQLWV